MKAKDKTESKAFTDVTTKRQENSNRDLNRFD